MTPPLQITIITSTEDIASTTIRNCLLSTYDFQPLSDFGRWNPDVIKNIHIYHPPEAAGLEITMIGVESRMTELDVVLEPEEIYGDLVIFASRHRSKAEKPALLCHTPGNWNDDISAGGKARKIAKGSGLLVHYLYSHLVSLTQERDFSFPVDQEVTHHGPTHFTAPLAFIELGSSEAQWTNKEGAQIVADAIIKTATDLFTNHFHNGTWQKKDIKVCVGFGGTHYMPNFSRNTLQGYGFVHTVPKYKVENITAETLGEIQQRILEPVDMWIVDWKGLNSAQKKSLIPLLEDTNIPMKKTKGLTKELLQQNSH